MPGGRDRSRMFIAQSLIEGCMLVSNERLFDRYGIERLW
jgi:PIN domain nuclease of toxin-antitoxin system